MTARTRFVLIASLLVLTVGLGTGMVAYYVGLPSGGRDTLPELRLVPRDAAVVAYANVHEIMASGIRRRILKAMPQRENGQREFENQTGIHIDTDIDRVVACLDAASADGNAPNLLVLARGRFDETRIEALMRDHGAHVETYNGKRLVVAPQTDPNNSDFGLAFIEPGLAAFGRERLIRSAIDLQKGGENVTANAELMNQIPALNVGNAWALGRFDVLRSTARIPDAVSQRIPPITLFSVSVHVGDDLTGVVHAQARDDEAAKTLRDVVRGFLSLAKLQSGANPRLGSVVQSLQLGGTGNDVTLSFSVPGQVFDDMSLPTPSPRRGERGSH
jgi:hypothetical protein